MRRLNLLVAFAVLACGGAPTDAGEDGPSVAADVVVVEGADQRGPPDAWFPDSVRVRVTDADGTPVEGQVINFQVATEEGGAFQTVTLQTNAEGVVVNRWRSGTAAWSRRLMQGKDSAHVAELIASRDGRPNLVQEIRAVVEPGPIYNLLFRLHESTEFGDLEVDIGDDLDVLAVSRWVADDSLHNPVPPQRLSGRAAKWKYWPDRPHMSNSFWDDFEAPEGTGWNAGPVPELHRHGWKREGSGTRFTIDTTAADPNYPPDSLVARGHLAVHVPSIGPQNRSDAHATIGLSVLLPACYEHFGATGDEEAEVQVTDWTPDCPKPWESW